MELIQCKEKKDQETWLYFSNICEAALKREENGDKKENVRNSGFQLKQSREKKDPMQEMLPSWTVEEFIYPKAG